MVSREMRETGWDAAGERAAADEEEAQQIEHEDSDYDERTAA